MSRLGKRTFVRVLAIAFAFAMLITSQVSAAPSASKVLQEPGTSTNLRFNSKLVTVKDYKMRVSISKVVTEFDEFMSVFVGFKKSKGKRSGQEPYREQTHHYDFGNIGKENTGQSFTANPTLTQGEIHLGEMMGDFGNVDANFTSSGDIKKVDYECSSSRSRVGTMTGTVDIIIGGYLGTTKLTDLGGTLTEQVTSHDKCPPPSPQECREVTDVHALSDGGLASGMSAWRQGKAVTLSAFSGGKDEPAYVNHVITARGALSAFPKPPADLSSATVHGIGPFFTGTATFGGDGKEPQSTESPCWRQRSTTGSITGDLTANWDVIEDQTWGTNKASLTHITKL